MTRCIYFDEPVPYAESVALQENLVARRKADEIPDTVLCLEHTPVITLGVRAREAHLLVPPETLTRRGIALANTPRGGDITYHAPGQLVIYLILKLADDEADARAFVRRLEEMAIRTAALYGVAAERRPGKTGAWTDRGKLAAIGVRFQKWVSSHGMSFNVDVDLAGFDLIVPCGLRGEPVTSLKALLGSACPSMAEVRDAMVRQFESVMGRPVEIVAYSSLPACL